MSDLAQQVALQRATAINAGVFGWNGYDTVDFRTAYLAGCNDALSAAAANNGAALAFVNSALSGIAGGTYAIPPPLPNTVPSADYKAGYKQALLEVQTAANAGAPPPAPATSDEPDGQTAPPPPPDVPITSP